MSENIENKLDETFNKMNDSLNSELGLNDLNQDNKPEETENLEESTEGLETTENLEESTEGLETTENVEEENLEESTENVEESTEPLEESDDTTILNNLLKQNNYFSHHIVGRHLVGNYSKENLKSFYEDFKASGILCDKSHYDLLQVLSRILGEK